MAAHKLISNLTLPWWLHLNSSLIRCQLVVHENTKEYQDLPCAPPKLSWITMSSFSPYCAFRVLSLQRQPACFLHSPWRCVALGCHLRLAARRCPDDFSHVQESPFWEDPRTGFEGPPWKILENHWAVRLFINSGLGTYFLRFSSLTCQGDRNNLDGLGYRASSFYFTKYLQKWISEFSGNFECCIFASRALIVSPSLSFSVFANACFKIKNKT